jgi:hypothetical protein
LIVGLKVRKGVGVVSDRLLPVVGNGRTSDNTTAASVAAMLQARLPAVWTASIRAAPSGGVLCGGRQQGHEISPQFDLTS